MSDLKVYDTTVPGILDCLKKGEWLVPMFQRDFVWSTDQVSALVQSILEARPIGMVTLWEQHDAGVMGLERVSITDQDPTTRRSRRISYGDNDERAAKTFALLDGRQRCTAIAMAFGGFRARNGQYRYSGRYYLDVTQLDPRKRVKYFKETDVIRLGLNTDSRCVEKGLFPLASNQEGEAVLSQWMRYLQALGNNANYPDGVLPSSDELSSRNKILQDAFQGIVNTKLAVYVVPEKYTLSDICDIFETLNTTGTKVSTVDLIHSWLFAETAEIEGQPFLLRDWINDFVQKDGAIGWGNSEDRPELLAQIVTACHVALFEKPPVRPNGSAITSIKSSDLLSTPARHWLNVRDNQDVLASSLGDAQLSVAGGYFPYAQCPYPASISIYVALRWHHQFDSADAHPWIIEELGALFRAFFWRNALTRRYDQGFLSQIGADIGFLKNILSLRPNYRSSGEWAVAANGQLNGLFEYPVPTRVELISYLTQGGIGGALQKALTLLMLAGAKRDIVNGMSLSYPANSPVELHHIFPRDWCRNNRGGALREILDPDIAGKDWANSISNLMPLSRQSNNEWRQRVPAQLISERNISFPPNQQGLSAAFIDSEAFELLCDANNPQRFWLKRAELMADAIIEKTQVVI